MPRVVLLLIFAFCASVTCVAQVTPCGFHMQAVSEGEPLSLCEDNVDELIAAMPSDAKLERAHLTLTIADMDDRQAIALGEKIIGQFAKLTTHVPCTASCSRLLLPAFTEVGHGRGYYALTDSSNPTYSAYLGRAVLGNTSKPPRTIDGSAVFKAERDYHHVLAKGYLAHSDYISRTKVSPAHLTENASALRRLRQNLPSRCLPIRHLSLVLTTDYLRSIGVRPVDGFIEPRRADVILSFNETEPAFIAAWIDAERPFFSGSADRGNTRPCG